MFHFCVLQIQEILADPGSVLQEYVTTINNCYPEEIVKYVCEMFYHYFNNLCVYIHTYVYTAIKPGIKYPITANVIVLCDNQTNHDD